MIKVLNFWYSKIVLRFFTENEKKLLINSERSTLKLKKSHFLSNETCYTNKINALPFMMPMYDYSKLNNKNVGEFCSAVSAFKVRSRFQSERLRIFMIYKLAALTCIRLFTLIVLVITSYIHLF